MRAADALRGASRALIYLAPDISCETQRSAIAITIIGGQSLCLFLTLLLVPAAYVKLDALEHSVVNQRLKALTSKLKFTRSKPAPQGQA